MTRPSTFRSAWQHKVLRGAMFTGAYFATLLPLANSALAVSKDSPKAIVDEAWQIVNREYVDGTFNRLDWQKTDRKSTRLNSSHRNTSRMPSSA